MLSTRVSQLTNHIFFAYGFRPFFFSTAVYAIVQIGLWGAYWQGWFAITLPQGAAVLHSFELLYGFTGAGLAGFLLTALPSWTETSPITKNKLVAVWLLWFLPRPLIWGSSLWRIWPVLGLNLLFMSVLLWISSATLTSRNHKKHHSLFWLVFLLWLSLFLALIGELGWIPFPIQKGVNMAIGVFVAMILTALGRISMVVVNHSLEQKGKEKTFLARPPKRNLAVISILIFTFVEIFWPHNSVTGWLALAAMAAVLNQLSDWHISHAVFDLYVFPLYLALWWIALGYLVLGWGLIDASTTIPVNARHLLTIGGIGGSILGVIVIAGTRHSGRPLVFCRYLLFSFILLHLSLIVRVLPPSVFPGLVPPTIWGMSSLLWCGAFFLYLIRFTPRFFQIRADGKPG